MRILPFVCLFLGLVGVATAKVSDSFDLYILNRNRTTINGTLQHNRRRNTAKLPVTLYYEALCPYCMQFITEQLGPSMLKQHRMRFTDLKLLPFGNAELNPSGNVVCQHGVEECELNAWHGCILEHHNAVESLKLISCMMKGKKNRLDICGTRYQIDVEDVRNCKETRSVDDILKKYAKESAKISFRGVPAVALDNVYDADESEKLTDNFDAIFCAKYKKKFNKNLSNCPKNITIDTK
ncbi:hypothetical protein KR009_002914 [Drosophila setifemur]|nr:hypothetical protein KR009_002914 [Drosophila setifemur]